MERSSRWKSLPSSAEPAPLPAKHTLILEQYELHYLVLVDHVHCNVARLRLGSEQRGTEHYGHALGGHAVGLSVVYHPEGRRVRGQKNGFSCSRIIQKTLKRSLTHTHTYRAGASAHTQCNTTERSRHEHNSLFK